MRNLEFMKSHRIGIIGPPLRHPDQDRREAWAEMARWGYAGIESGSLAGETLDETKANREHLESLGLAVAGIGCSHRDPDKLASAIEHASVLGTKNITTFYGPVESEEQLIAEAEVLEGMAQQCADAGLKFCYHNHDHEFRNTFRGKGNVNAIDILLEEAPHLFLELDIGWCHSGGVDPLYLIRRHPERIGALHLRDIGDRSPRGRFTMLGLGLTPVFGCIEAAAAHGVEWMIVEMGRNGPGSLNGFEGAVGTILNLRAAGLA